MAGFHGRAQRTGGRHRDPKVLGEQSTICLAQIGQFAPTIKTFKNTNATGHVQAFFGGVTTGLLFVDQSQINGQLLRQKNRADFACAQARSLDCQSHGANLVNGNDLDPSGLIRLVGPG